MLGEWEDGLRAYSGGALCVRQYLRCFNSRRRYMKQKIVPRLIDTLNGLEAFQDYGRRVPRNGGPWDASVYVGHFRQKIASMSSNLSSSAGIPTITHRTHYDV